MKSTSFTSKPSGFAARIVIFALAIMCCVSMVSAQTETARLSGEITDSAGAAVAGATITVMNSATGREVKAVSDADGSYTVLSLNPGAYEVTVGQTNFKTSKRELTLAVGQVATVDFSLEAGSVSETVTVSSDQPLVDSSSSAIGSVVQGEDIIKLPLNGRNVLELARLSPGVTQGVVGGFATGSGGNAETYRGGNTGGAALAVNGQRTQANNFLLDGVDNNESLVNTINVFPSADAVQEFRVQTSVATAEFGRGGGAIVNAVTRSGGRDYHGSSFLFIRNNALDARPAFFDSVAEKRRLPLFRRSQFGGTVGGPVLPVTSWKDKLFFFFSYDGLRQFLPRATDTATVPTAAFRLGDFSALNVQLRDPLTNQNICVTGSTTNGILCVNGNGVPFNRLDQLPGNRLNAAALAYLRAYPNPNFNPGGSTPWLGNYTITRNEINKQDNFDFRVDANVTAKDQVFFRGNYGRYSQKVTSRLPALPAGFGSGSNPTRTKGGVIGWNRSLSTNIFNEMRVQANRIKYGYEPPFGDEAISQKLGIVNANRDSSLGGGALIGGYNGQLEYTGDYGPYRVPQDTLQLLDSVSWVRGRHTIKFGGSIVHREVQLFRPIAGKGYFRIYGNGDYTQCPGAAGAPSLAASGNTGFEQANLLIGFMCSYQIGVQNGNVGTTNWENAFFGQDDFRVSDRLTLNLGLRYEYFTNPAERYGRQSNFDLATGRLILAADKSDTLTRTDKNNFSPRLGFAYDVKGNGKTVVRGGFGIFYFLDRGGISNQLAQNAPYSGSASYSYNDGYRFTFSGAAPLNSNDNRLATGPLPLPQVNTSAAFLNNPLNTDVIAVRPDNKTSNVMQYNIQLQQQLTSDTALSVGYVGTRGRNLIVYYNLNGQVYSPDTAVNCPIAGRTVGNCYPGVASVNVRDDIGRSSYNSLQIQLARRMNKGWQYQAAYTWSKTKDNGDGPFDAVAGGVNYIEPYTMSRIDYPHVFSYETVYQLPFGRGRSYGGDMSRALDYLVGGWDINAIYRIQSGNPFDVRNNGRLVNLVGDPYTGNSNKTPFLNRSAFTVPATGLGSLGRNSLRSPMTSQLNMGISKDFGFTEDLKLQFRAEAYNLFNTIQWGTPNTDLNNSSTFSGFGTIRGTAPYSNRQLQFGLRLEF